MKKTKSLFAAFAFWYTIGVFLSGYFNPMDWINFGKIVYLLFVSYTYTEATKNLD